jgi:hypothetical protein
MPQRPPLVIFAAVEPEARAIARELGMNGTPGGARRARVNDRDVELYTVGLRAQRLPWEIRPGRAELIIVAGVAGALDPQLHRGDVILHNWPQDRPLGKGMRRGVIHSAENICAIPLHKERLFRLTNASAVDMEQAHVERLANGVSLPCIGIRAILDTAHEILQGDLLDVIDESGRPSLGRLGPFLLRRPWRTADLVRLGWASRTAMASLRLGVKFAVMELTTPPAAPKEVSR